MGARSAGEARGFVVLVASLRRRVGLMAAREMARHRLRRMGYIGVPRTALGAAHRFHMQQRRMNEAAAPLHGAPARRSPSRSRAGTW